MSINASVMSRRLRRLALFVVSMPSALRTKLSMVRLLWATRLIAKALACAVYPRPGRLEAPPRPSNLVCVSCPFLRSISKRKLEAACHSGLLYGYFCANLRPTRPGANHALEQAFCVDQTDRELPVKIKLREFPSNPGRFVGSRQTQCDSFCPSAI